MNEKSEMPNERRSAIVEAATAVFLRYGFARTTMGDIASAAGLSRPTLYLSFPDKSRIFRAVIEAMVAAELRNLREGLATRDGFGAQLGFLCESWTLHGFDLVQASPDARDMFDLGFEVVQESYTAFEDLLAEFIANHPQLVSRRPPPRDLARMIVAGMKGFKDIARDRNDLLTMIRSLCETVSLAACRTDAGGLVTAGVAEE